MGYLLSPLCWWNDLAINLRHGLITSTLYTLAIALLLQFHLIEPPDFLQGDVLAQLTALLPDWLQG